MTESTDGAPEQISAAMYTAAGLLSLGAGFLFSANVVARLLDGAGLAVVPALALALVFLSVAVVTLPPLRAAVENGHSVWTFGRKRRVDRRIVDDPDHGEPCVSCGDAVTEGVERRYRDEFVVAGVSVMLYGVGYNSYCVDCAAAETAPDTLTDGDRETEPERPR